jgi:cytochrome c1
MVSTARVVAAAAQPDARAAVNAFIARGDVQDVMTRWGVDPEEANARVAALTDEEVSDLAARIEAMPAGGEVVGIIVGAILLVFFVLLLTDLLGLTDIFPFIKKKH